MPHKQRETQDVSWDSVDLDPTGHEGSAPMNLTGGGVVSAWMGSLLLHVLALGVMFLIVFPFSPNLADEEVSIANVQLVGEIDAIPMSPINVPDPPTTREKASESRQVQPTVEPEESVEALIDPSSMKTPDYAVLAIRAVGNDGNPWAGASAPAGDLGPNFFGVGGSARGARTVVYVVDHSRSMIATFKYVKRELLDSVRSLKRSQKFHVIFFSERMPTEFPPKRFVNAIRVYTDQFKTWLDGIPLGQGTEPEAALRRALSMQPDVLYFLTDANGLVFGSDLRNKLDEWNKDRRTRIFTVAYVTRSGRRFLETIAREHGGECRYVSEDDLPDD